MANEAEIRREKEARLKELNKICEYHHLNAVEGECSCAYCLERKQLLFWLYGV